VAGQFAYGWILVTLLMPIFIPAILGSASAALAKQSCSLALGAANAVATVRSATTDRNKLLMGGVTPNR